MVYYPLVALDSIFFFLLTTTYILYTQSELVIILNSVQANPSTWLLVCLTGFLGILGFIKAINSLPLFIVIPFTTLNLISPVASYYFLQITATGLQITGISFGILGLTLIYYQQDTFYSSSTGWRWLILTIICWGISYPLSQSLIQSTSPLFFATSIELVVFTGCTLILPFKKELRSHMMSGVMPIFKHYIILVALLIVGVLTNGLARQHINPLAMLAFSTFSEIGLIIAGYYFFNERMSLLQRMGLIITIVASFFMF